MSYANQASASTCPPPLRAVDSSPVNSSLGELTKQQGMTHDLIDQLFSRLAFVTRTELEGNNKGEAGRPMMASPLLEAITQRGDCAAGINERLRVLLDRIVD